VLTVVNNNEGSNPAGQDRSILDEIVRDGARQMLAAALRAEVAAYIGSSHLIGVWCCPTLCRVGD
jgi:putative transposase